MATQETKIVVTADTRQAQKALGDLQGTLRGLVTITALGALVQQFAKLSDESTNLQNKLGQVAEQGQTSTDMFNLMAKSALMLGAPLKDVGDLFFRISSTTKDLAVSQSEVLRVTELLTKGFQLNGQSSAQAAASTVQLGQAFGQGVLRGDELNSVMESLPAVADALSVKFGVQRGALKALGEQGKITSRDLFDAITQSGASIDAAWGKRIPTITDSFNRLGTVVGVLTQRFNEQSGAGNALSYALLIVADAVITTYEWFQKWGKLLVFIGELIAFVYIPLKIMRAIFVALIGPIEAVIGLIRGGAAAFESIGVQLTKFAEYLFPITEGVTLLGNKITAVFAGIAGLAGALGLGTLFANLNSMFSDDQVAAADKYQKKLDDVNKRLGLDSVQASNAAKEASKLKTAQMLKDEDAIKKATQDRNEDIKKILRDQQSELGLTKYIGDELTVQSAIYSANKSLVRAIKNDKGETIGYTKALSAEEEKTLRLLTEQSIELKRQQDIRQKLATYATPLAPSAAGAEVAGQMPSLDPITAAQTANQNLYTGLEYLRNQDLIGEQAYQAAKVNLAIQSQNAIYEATKKQYENEALLRIQSTTGSQFGFETQKAMAAEAANFEKKSQLEKTQFAVDQSAQMFTALGAQNKKAFEAAKAFNIANAIMNTFMGATKALATYPPPFNFIAAAATVAMGMAQVNSIRSQQYSGRALGGPVMGGTPYIVGENGPEIFTPATTGSITRNSDAFGGGGPTNINFTIQANDASGFDQLLLERKGMIQQFVSDAMMERGQRSKM